MWQHLYIQEVQAGLIYVAQGKVKCYICSSAIFSVVQEHKLHFHWFIHCMIPNIQEGDSRDVPIIRSAIQNTLYQQIFFILVLISIHIRLLADLI